VTTTPNEPARTEQSRRDLAIVDCDVHPTVGGGIARLFPYMESGWQRRFENRDVVANSPFPAVRFSHPLGFLRRDAGTPGGGAAGTDPEYLVAHHMDPNRIASAVLLSLQAGALAAWVNAEEAAALATAFNRFFIEEWLPVDRRFNYAVVVAPQDPALAAAEVRRLGGEDRVIGVFLPLIDRLMGHRHYFPIYEAAAELGLPIVLHGSGAETIYTGAPANAGGIPSTYTERYVGMPQIAQANLISLIFEGVFERFPSLKVAFAEWGFSWAPSVMWRMDKAWKGLRVEVPWVKRRPTEYVLDHVRFTTEPIDEPDDPAHLHHVCDMMHAERTLLFSTDYPHWDNDMPAFVLAKLPERLRERVASANARETFGERLSGSW
jgi:predicted TIM-barrel fold metal-dependent hydrolase